MNNESGESREIVSELNERLINGIFKENPTFVLLLGMCPTLAVTTCAVNGLGMGLTTLVVLAMSNLIISALRNVIPSKVRIPAFIVIIASFVTIIEMLLKAYIPTIYDSLGIYIPLIVVNCIILGRAEAYAYHHGPLLSLFDGIGMGMGFTVALTVIGAFREILGAGTLFSRTIMPSGFVPVSIFVMAPGAFFVLAMLTAIQNAIKNVGEKHGRDMSKIQSGCGGNCLECNKECKKDYRVSTVADTALPESEDKADLSDSFDAKENFKDDDTGLEDAAKSDSENAEASGDSVSGAIPETENESAEIPEKEADDVNSDDVFVSDFDVNAAGESESADVMQNDSGETADESLSEKNIGKSDNDIVDDELELLNLDDYKRAINKTLPSGKRTARKKASFEKAQALFNKASETLKEEGEADD